MKAELEQVVALLQELFGPRYAALLPPQLHTLFGKAARQLEGHLAAELAHVVARTQEELLEAQVARVLARLPGFVLREKRLHGAVERAARRTLQFVATAARGSLGASDAELVAAARRAHFMEMYLTWPEEVGYALLRAMVSAERASEDEWQFAMKTMRGCFECATTLLGLPEHGHW